jgi:MFS family permease
MGGSIASLFGGLLSYGIGHLDSGLTSWQYLFLIFGAVTALCGIIMLAFHPDAPSKTFWLTFRGAIYRNKQRHG